MKWFARNGTGHVRGPLETEEICRWVREGRLKPTDWISTDQEVWIQALELPDLQEEAASAPADAQPAPAAPEPPPQDPPVAAPPEEGAHDTFEYTPEKWSLEKEVERWKAWYERERRRWTTAVERMKQQVERLEREQATRFEELEELRLAHRRLKESYEELQEAAGTEPDDLKRKLQLLTQRNIALRNSCDALAQSHDVLVRQLSEKTAEQETLQVLRDEAERAAEERLHALTEQLAKERELNATLRRHLVEVEKEYELVARTCKEMNQHLIEHPM